MVRTTRRAKRKRFRGPARGRASFLQGMRTDFAGPDAEKGRAARKSRRPLTSPRRRVRQQRQKIQPHHRPAARECDGGRDGRGAGERISMTTFADIEAARHGMTSFARRWTCRPRPLHLALRRHGCREDLPGIPTCSASSRKPRRTKLGGDWHTDSPFLERPPSISLGVDIPPYGGDTMWANTRLAFHYLSDTMKAMLRPLKVTMTARDVIGFIAEQSAEDHACRRTFVKRRQARREADQAGNTRSCAGIRWRASIYVRQTYALKSKGSAGAKPTHSRVPARASPTRFHLPPPLSEEYGAMGQPHLPASRQRSRRLQARDDPR